MPRRKNKYEPSQADNRRFTRLRDQHGRMWEGIMDIKNGGIVGPLRPVNVDPPLIPPTKYFRFPALQDGTFRIDYQAWISDREEGKRMYERRKIKYTQKMYGESAGEVLQKEQLPAELLRIVGTEPDPVEPVLAASAGNKWILGLSDRKPEWAYEYFPEEEEQEQVYPWTQEKDEVMAELRERFPDAELSEAQAPEDGANFQFADE